MAGTGGLLVAIFYDGVRNDPVASVLNRLPFRGWTIGQLLLMIGALLVVGSIVFTAGMLLALRPKRVRKPRGRRGKGKAKGKRGSKVDDDDLDLPEDLPDMEDDEGGWGDEWDEDDAESYGASGEYDEYDERGETGYRRSSGRYADDDDDPPDRSRSARPSPPGRRR